MLLRRALPDARQKTARPFPIYQRDSNLWQPRKHAPQGNQGKGGRASAATVPWRETIARRLLPHNSITGAHKFPDQIQFRFASDGVRFLERMKFQIQTGSFKHLNLSPRLRK